MGSPRKSPYKKVSSRNNSYVVYRNIGDLEANRPYRIYDITPTEHVQFGPGQMAFITNAKRLKFKVQLPKKYLTSLDPGDIEIFKKDIADGKAPYLIFREKLPDNSYRIDIAEANDDIKEKFRLWESVSELNYSNTSEESVACKSPPSKVVKLDDEKL